MNVQPSQVTFPASHSSDSEREQVFLVPVLGAYTGSQRTFFLTHAQQGTPSFLKQERPWDFALLSGFYCEKGAVFRCGHTRAL